MSDSSARPTSREYLEQMRQRRQQRSGVSEVAATPETLSSPPPSSEQYLNAPYTQSELPSPPPPQSQAPLPPPPQQAAPEFPPVNPEMANRPLPEELVAEWLAPSRPFKKRNRQYFSTVFIIALLVCLILFFAGQFLPIAAVIALAFLAYVLNTFPPEIIKYQVTTYGMRLDNQLYFWDELSRYWFSNKYGSNLLHLEVNRFPFHLTLVLGEVNPSEIDELLSEVLLHQKPHPSYFEQAAEWLQQKLPLDAETQPSSQPPSASPTPTSAPPAQS
ncbi:MAG TPA: hypothetical protein VD999_03400 [Vitreimonas sp.]|nr:hypothetical protein [Vitreimonas sp.]